MYEEINISWNELRNLSGTTLKGRTLIKTPCGDGKTFKIPEWYWYAKRQGALVIVVVMQTHQLIDEHLKKFQDRYDNVIHLKGRTQPGLCKRPKNKKYILPCSECKLAENCTWRKQRAKLNILEKQRSFDLELKQRILEIEPEDDNMDILTDLLFVDEVVPKLECTLFIVPQMYNIIVPPFQPDVIIVDENMDDFLRPMGTVPSRLRQYMQFVQDEDCPNKHCNFFHENKCNAKACFLWEMKPQRLVHIEKIEPEDDIEKFILEDLQQKNVVVYKYGGKYHCGYKRDLTLGPDTMFILNDATANVELTQSLFGFTFNRVITADPPIINTVVHLKAGGGVDSIEQKVEDILWLLKLLEFPNTKETLIVSRLRNEDNLRKKVKTELLHYNASTGTNKYERCRYVLLLGHIRKNTAQQYIEYKTHFETNNYTWEQYEEQNLIWERAQHEQALHRIRPLLSSNKEIAFYMIDAPIEPTITIGRVKKTLEVFKHLKEYEGDKKSTVPREVVDNLVALGHIKECESYAARIQPTR